MVALTEGALWSILTRADRIFALILALAAVAAVLHGRYGGEVGTALVVEIAGAAPATHALADLHRLRLRGQLGETEIEVGPEGARVVAAPCLHKLCMRRGWIRRRGDLTVCVPNGLVLRVAGAAAVDAVVR